MKFLSTIRNSILAKFTGKNILSLMKQLFKLLTVGIIISSSQTTWASSCPSLFSKDWFKETFIGDSWLEHDPHLSQVGAYSKDDLNFYMEDIHGNDKNFKIIAKDASIWNYNSEWAARRNIDRTLTDFVQFHNIRVIDEEGHRYLLDHDFIYAKGALDDICSQLTGGEYPLSSQVIYDQNYSAMTVIKNFWGFKPKKLYLQRDKQSGVSYFVVRENNENESYDKQLKCVRAN